MPYVIINDRDKEQPPRYYKGEGWTSTAQTTTDPEQAFVYPTATDVAHVISPELYSLGWRVVPIK